MIFYIFYTARKETMTTNEKIETLKRLLIMLESKPVTLPYPEGVWKPFKDGYVIQPEDLNVIEEYRNTIHTERYVLKTMENEIHNKFEYETETLWSGEHAIVYIHFYDIDDVRIFFKRLIEWLKWGWIK